MDTDASRLELSGPEDLANTPCSKVPEAYSLIHAAAGKKVALVVPGHAPDWMAMPLERRHTPLLGKAPELHTHVS